MASVANVTDEEEAGDDESNKQSEKRSSRNVDDLGKYGTGPSYKRDDEDDDNLVGWSCKATAERISSLSPAPMKSPRCSSSQTGNSI